MHIIACKAQIKLTVIADGKLLYHLVRLKAFAPKFHSISN